MEGPGYSQRERASKLDQLLEDRGSIPLPGTFHEYEIRPKCLNCDGVGGFAYGPLDHVKICFVCQGSGRMPWPRIEGVELAVQERSAKAEVCGVSEAGEDESKHV